MLLQFVILGVLASLGGGGGLSKVYSQVKLEGYGYSKYRVKNALKELSKIGAVVKTGETYMLTILGANLVAADIAAAQGWEVVYANEYIQMPGYQKGGLK